MAEQKLPLVPEELSEIRKILSKVSQNGRQKKVTNLSDSESEPEDSEQENKEVSSNDPSCPPDVKSTKKFRFQSKRAFLTYPKCDHPPHFVYQVLDGRFPLLSFAGVQERHQDMSLHLHCLVVFQKKVRSRNPRVFDLPLSSEIPTSDGQGHHPNIKLVKEMLFPLEYMMKSNNVVFLGPKASYLVAFAWTRGLRN